MDGQWLRAALGGGGVCRDYGHMLLEMWWLVTQFQHRQQQSTAHPHLLQKQIFYKPYPTR